MSSVVISGDTSGSVTLAAPAVAGTTTLTLPATTGTMALTSDSIGMVLLGTLTTTSGATAILSGLTLTGYKQLMFAVDRVSHNSGTSQSLRLLDANGSTQLTIGNSTGLGSFTTSTYVIDLATGVLSGITGDAITVPPFASITNTAVIGRTSFSTSATSVQFSFSGGSFDAGQILVYGVK